MSDFASKGFTFGKGHSPQRNDYKHTLCPKKYPVRQTFRPNDQLDSVRGKQKKKAMMGNHVVTATCDRTIQICMVMVS